VAHARTGLVVGSGGGAWGKLFPLFRLGLGGRLGSGRQYWSYISLQDEVAALRHIITTESLSGPVNLTAPVPVTNAEVTAAMGAVLHRPTLCAVEVVGSHRVVPGRLLDSGFSFRHTTVEQAIRAALR
jgi:NAD dependent epimerase/dehydratase family enzyme